MKEFIKRLLMENLEGVQYIYHGDVEDDDAYDRYEIEANAMAKNNGIGLGSNDLAYIALMGDKLIGATWIGVAGVFSFDIVVDSDYQGLKVGSRLIDMVMDKYESRVKLSGGDYGIRVNVVNDNLKEYLIKKYGLVEDGNERNILVNPSKDLNEGINGLPVELRGKKVEANIIGRNRLCVKGEIELSKIDIVLDNGIKTAKDKFDSDKKFKISKNPIVIGVDIDNGKTQLLDGYHRYVYNGGKGILKAYFIPMKGGDIIDFSEI